MKKMREKILNKIVDVFRVDERVHSIFVTGSMNDGDLVTPLSDIDLWIILNEESGINAMKKELLHYFGKIASVRMMYPCTDHHYLVIFKNGVQIDFNMATAACYYSLISTKKKILADNKLAHTLKKPSALSKHIDYVSEQLVIGYTTLERAVSKYLKGDYIVTVRFIDGIRSNTVFSLLPFIERVFIPNVVTVPLNKLSPEVRDKVVASYAQPTKKSCKTALFAIMFLLEHISKKTKSHAANDIHAKLQIILSKL